MATPTLDASALSAAGIPWRVELIPVTELEPNPWNPNAMDAATLTAERESIQTYGFIDPLTVREHAERFQIIDGEHRWRVATELDYEALPCVVLEADDATAKKLTVILNETRGQADPVLLAELLGDLRSRLNEDDAALRAGMPYNDDELRALLRVNEDDWDGYREGKHQTREQPRDWFSVRLDLPAELEPVFAACTDHLRERADLDPEPRIRDGQVVVALIRHLVKHGT
jgi:ParB-like chromosome segregation protein Spo0J